MITLTGQAYCSGVLGQGQLGNGTLGVVGGPLPVAVAAGHRFQSISTNRTFACAVAVDGQAYCWGVSSSGALGTGTTSAQHAAPEPVAGEHIFASITTGQYHTCALTLGGVAYCWGRNTDGRLGSHLADVHAVPVRVGGPYVWRSLSAGGLYTCGVTVDDEMYCWGSRYNR